MPPTSAELIDAAIHREFTEPNFDPLEARVSGVGYCQTQQVAFALDPSLRLGFKFPWLYGERGHALEYRLFGRFKRMEPDAEWQVAVPSPTGGTTHPDILRPSASTCLQVKTTSDHNVLNGHAHAAWRWQVNLEWRSWQKAGYCITTDGRRIEMVPRIYELALLGAESFGWVRNFLPVRFDVDIADRAEERLHQTQGFIDCGYVPPRDKARPDFECVSTMTGERCPLYSLCWGD